MSIGIKYEHSIRVIRSCKICGAIPSVHKAFNSHLYKIECADCGVTSGDWSTMDYAISNWDLEMESSYVLKEKGWAKKNAIDYFEKRILLLDRWLKRQPPVLKSDPYLEERNAIMVALTELKGITK